MATPIYNAGLKPPVLSALGTIDAPPSLSPLAPMSAPSLPPMDAPVAPDVTVNQRISSVSSDPLLTRKDQLESDLYNRSNPVAPTTALGKIGHVAANIGNILGDIFAPATMSLIPGTQLNNQAMRGRDINELQDVSQEQTAADARKQTEANTAYTQQRPQIEQAKILQKLTSSLAPKGIIAKMNPDGTIDTEDDPTSQAYQNQQSLSAMHQATADKDSIMGEIAANHYQPGTPEYDEAQRKLAQVDQRLGAAMAGLGLRRDSLNLRARNQAAQNTGIDPTTGKPFAGAAQISGDNGASTTVGSRFAGHAITQQGTVGSFNDLSGSIDHAQGVLQNFFDEGGTLNDPAVISALQDKHTPLAQWVGGLVQSGLTPKAIAAVTALRQSREQAGILRAATKGTGSEAGAQRILDTVPDAGDSNDVAMAKIQEMKNVRDRLAPGMTSVAGGISVIGKPKANAAQGISSGGNSSNVEEYVRDATGKLVKKVAK
jgi:hypothetical protein